MDIDEVEKCWQAYADAVQEAYKRKTSAAPALAVWIVTDAENCPGRVIGVFDSEKKARTFCDEREESAHINYWETK